MLYRYGDHFQGLFDPATVVPYSPPSKVVPQSERERRARRWQSSGPCQPTGVTVRGETYVKNNRFTAATSALVLIDHQFGTMQLVKTLDLERVKRHTLALARAARILRK